MKNPVMVSVWGGHLLVTKGGTLNIRLRVNIVVQMCFVTSDCLLWPHRILVVSRSLFVLRIDRVLYFLRQFL